MEAKENMAETLDEVLKILENDCQENKNYENTIPAEALQRQRLSSKISNALELELHDLVLKSDESTKFSKSEKIKCCPTLIGGTNSSPESGILVDPRTCSALHCRDCDFSVTSFPDHEWNGLVDYLFLRTYMPDMEKVSTKLRRKKGTVAYACHCVSFSTNKLESVHEKLLPWFCRGHVKSFFSS